LGRATLVKVYFEKLPAYQHQSFQAATVDALRRLPGVRSASLAVYTHGAESNHLGQQHNFTLFGVDEFFWEVCGLSPKGDNFSTTRTLLSASGESC